MNAASRYTVYEEIASGGMASVHFGHLRAGAGFSKRVAIKRMHPHCAKDPDFASMFLDEARLAARIHHPNVVQTLDVVTGPSLEIVLEYVHGESLSRLVESGEAVPVPVALAIMVGVLRGLEAAHRAKSDGGEPLGIVHRDVSPQNILVGADGLARLSDFGIAKARGRMRTTPSGEVRGKLAYVAPEQLSGKPVGKTADVFSASIVLWELCTGRRLFAAEHEAQTVANVISGPIAPPSRHRPDVTVALDAIILRGLARDVGRRYVSAEEMASALEATGSVASASKVAAWVERVAGRALAEREHRFEAIERVSPAAGRVQTVHRPRSRVLIGGALLAMAAVGVPLLVLRGVEPHRAPVGAAEPVREASAASSSSAAEEVAASSTVAITSPPEAAPSAASSAPPAPAKVVVPGPPKGAPAKPGCKTPYIVDERGIHHIKPECL